jgi:hypothetical protein
MGLRSSEGQVAPLYNVPELVKELPCEDRVSLCVDVGLGATLTPYAVSVPRAVVCGGSRADCASRAGCA